MRTINLQTVYQLVITALLLGACLGLLGQRLPALLEGASLSFEQPIVAAGSSRIPYLANAAAHNTPAYPVAQPPALVQDTTTSKTEDANVQVEVEVHTRGNASAQASALGPGDTKVQANAEGDSDGRSVAYLKAPTITDWSPAVQESAVPESTLLESSLTNAQPQAKVTEAVANLRTSPTLAGAVAGTAPRGQEFTVVGRDQSNTWWLVCCDRAQSLWIYSGVVQVTGNFERVGVVRQATAVTNLNNAELVGLPTPTLAPTLAPVMPTALPPVTYEFMLAEQTQFEEHIVPRIFFYVYQQEAGLGGYTVHVRKDGVDLPVTKTTVAGLPGYTWPIPNERQRYTNLKVEFPHVTAAGLWEAQLFDAAGNAVGPVATFRLQPNDTRQEMYVRYRKQ